MLKIGDKVIFDAKKYTDILFLNELIDHVSEKNKVSNYLRILHKKTGVVSGKYCSSISITFNEINCPYRRTTSFLYKEKYYKCFLLINDNNKFCKNKSIDQTTV